MTRTDAIRLATALPKDASNIRFGLDSIVFSSYESPNPWWVPRNYEAKYRKVGRAPRWRMSLIMLRSQCISNFDTGWGALVTPTNNFSVVEGKLAREWIGFTSENDLPIKLFVICMVAADKKDHQALGAQMPKMLREMEIIIERRRFTLIPQE